MDSNDINVKVDNINAKIDTTIACYEESKTDDNSRFVEGVIYGMSIAKAIIQGEK